LPSEDFKTNICYIKEAKWDILPAQHLVTKHFDFPDSSKPLTASHQMQKGEMLRFTVTSNRFLRGMIRKIVGTVLMVGKDRITLDEFNDNVANQKPFRIHYLAPPNGLFLSNVRYPYID